MKKIATLVFALLLGASLSFAQTGGGTDKDKGKGEAKGDTTKGKSGKKGHKGGKKSKKGEKGESSTAPPPK